MNIDYFLSVLRARWYIAAIVLFMTVFTTVAISLILPKSYTASATIVLDTRGDDVISGGIATSTMISGGSYVMTQVDIMGSRKVALRVVKDLRIDANPEARTEYESDPASQTMTITDFFADRFLRDLKVNPSRESRVVSIDYSSNSPQMAAQLANAFARAYVNTVLELRVLPAQRNAAWYEQQVAKLRGELERARARLSEYQQQTGIVSSEERLDVENARLAELSSQLVAVQNVTYESKAREEQVRAVRAGKASADTVPDVLHNQLIQQLKMEQIRAESRLKDMATRVGQNHPDYLRAESEVASIKRQAAAQVNQVLDSLDKLYAMNRAREDEIRGALAAQKDKILEIRQKRDEIDLLNHQVENAQRSYDMALQRSTQVQMEGNLSQSNVEVLTEAVPPTSPSSPKILLNTLLAIFVGTALGLGFALLLEFIDTRIRSKRDLEDLLDIPLLGELTNATSITRSKRWRWLPGFRRLGLPKPAGSGG